MDIHVREEDLTPSHREYWDNFYCEGLGIKQYEWYDLQYEDLETHLTSIFEAYLPKKLSSPKELLQVGVGNSLILETLFEEYKTLPLQITNIDISSESIEWMTKRQEELPKGKKKVLQKYLQMDACQMTFEPNSFSFIFDKGTLDALLSHGEDEFGETERIQQYFGEIFRVLEPNGLFLLISGNDPFVLNPYFYLFPWTSVDQIPLERKRKKNGSSDFGQLPINLWLLRKPDETIEEIN